MPKGKQYEQIIKEIINFKNFPILINKNCGIYRFKNHFQIYYYSDIKKIQFIFF